MRTIYIYIYTYLDMRTLLSLAGTFRKGQKGKAGKTSRGYARGRVFGVLRESLFTLQPEMLLYIYIIVEIPNARQWLDFEVALPFAAILDCIVRKPWTLPDDSWLRAWHFLVCSPHIMQTLYNIFYLRFCRKH